LEKSAQGQGCDLIPWSSQRATCKDANVHGLDSCNANPQTCATATTCVQQRELVQQQFSKAKSSLESCKNGAWKSDKAFKEAATTIVVAIKSGEQGHQTAINNAKKLKARLCGQGEPASN
jgi:hypothetical protein